jgi:hypothetical protein
MWDLMAVVGFIRRTITEFLSSTTSLGLLKDAVCAIMDSTARHASIAFAQSQRTGNCSVMDMGHASKRLAIASASMASVVLTVPSEVVQSGTTVLATTRENAESKAPLVDH